MAVGTRNPGSDAFLGSWDTEVRGVTAGLDSQRSKESSHVEGFLRRKVEGWRGIGFDLAAGSGGFPGGCSRLLDEMVTHCSEIVHMHIARRNVLHRMVKIAKKKPDPLVREKILVLIETWQEALGGPMGRYLEFFQAYQDLLQAGLIYPRRRDLSAPNPPSSDRYSRKDEESSSDMEFPHLSLEEIQKARGTMNVLSEMLTTLNPDDIEELKKDVIVDLVEQCRANRRKAFHVISTTSDDELLCQCLALHDDLQQALSKHGALVSRIPTQGKEHKTPPPLVDIAGAGQAQNNPFETNESSGPSTILLLDAPPMSGEMSGAGSLVPVTNSDQMADLFTWDNAALNTSAESSLELVPVHGPDAINSGTDRKGITGQGNEPLPPPPWEIQATEEDIEGRESISFDPRGGIDSHAFHTSLLAESHPHLSKVSPLPGAHSSFAQFGQQIPINHNMQVIHVAAVDYVNPVHGGHGNYYVHGQQPGIQCYDLIRSTNSCVNLQDVSQRMYAPAVWLENSGEMNVTQSYRLPTSPSMASFQGPASTLLKAPQPEDKLFGDLVSMAKSSSTATFG